MTRRVVVIGLDGLDPTLVEAGMRAGELPALAGLRERGSYSRLATTYPAQTPVAWSTFATGVNPGVHGVFDFLRRDPARHVPENGLFRYERRGAFLPPRAVNLRGGRPVWAVLGDAGLPATVLRHPCTFPPDAPRGRLLAGVGVPDLRGGFGTSTWLTTDAAEAPAGESERVVALEARPDGTLQGYLPGPPTGPDSEARFSLGVVPGPQGVTVVSAGEPAELPVDLGRWSDWLSVTFRLGTLQRVRGLVRFHLGRAAPEVGLHASPVAFDPDAPFFAISHPWDYAGSLRRRLGLYSTLGVAEDHGGLDAGRFGEAAFLEQCAGVMAERRAMLFHELERLEEGLLFCLFDTPDRVQHMFWRFRDAEHPANGGRPPDPRWTGTIADHYRECDALVAEVLEALDPDTLVVVLSDHGFATFRRELDLNAWLRDRGLLALRPGVSPGEEGLLRGVDWSRTRAYAVGLAGIFLNLRGREAEGIVEPEDAPRLRERIAGELAGARDEAGGGAAVRRVLPSSALYRGPRAAEGPDLVVCCEPGWRVSAECALGGVSAGVFSDNLRRWSGDHVVDPEGVPGVLFSSRRLVPGKHRLEDLAPTLLSALGVPAPEEWEGRDLLA